MIRRLLDWYAAHRRDLPWRRAPSPWRVLVSEAMLQQTRVAAVLPRYEEFLRRFPDPATMARASEDEVVAAWSGLGYYRRARSLHAAARAIARDHGGEVPAERRAVRALPGVGDYTAGAVLSIAFGLPEPVVDGNVERVFARHDAIRGDPKRNPAKAAILARAREAVAAGPPGDVNQALMELGALVCTPRSPACGACPAAESCVARREGLVERLPELPRPPETVEVTLAAAIARRGDRALLVRAPAGGFLAGTFAPPFARVPEGADPGTTLRAAARSGHGLDLDLGAELPPVRHRITRHRITARRFEARVAGADGLFRAPADFPGLAISSLASKLLGD